MSQVTATTTTPLMTVVCSRAFPISTTVKMALTFVGLEPLGQHDVVLPPQLILTEKMKDSIRITTVLPQQQPQSQKPSQVNCAMGPPQVCSTFQSWSSYQFIRLFVGASHGVCFLISGSHVDEMLSTGGSITGVCNATTVWSIPLAGICACWWWFIASGKKALIALLWLGGLLLSFY